MVLGSTNWDICMYLPTLPAPGDTVGDGRLKTAIGGKGANQAVACFLAEASSQFISCIGDDASATTILQTFNNIGLNTDAVTSVANCSTGTACIFIDAAGENCIGLTAGANAHLDSAVVKRQQHIIQQAGVLLMQLEVPLESVLLAAELAKQNATQVILNPAPAQPLPDALYHNIDILTPNRGELAILSGVATDSDDGLQQACDILLSKGVSMLLVTLGSDGVMLATNKATQRYAAFTVEAVDTTAAGDVFNGYFAAELARRQINNAADLDIAANKDALRDAIEQAMAAAAIAVTGEGAIPSIPSRADVTRFRQRH